MTVSSEVRTVKGPKLRLGHILLNAEGKQVAEHWMDVNSANMATNVLVVKEAQLWSPEQPYLYTLVTRVTEGNKVWDEQRQQVGIRQTEYDAEGFKLRNSIGRVDADEGAHRLLWCKALHAVLAHHLMLTGSMECGRRELLSRGGESHKEGKYVTDAFHYGRIYPCR